MKHLLGIFIAFWFLACTQTPDSAKTEVSSYAMEEKTASPDECIEKAMGVKDQALAAILAKEGAKNFEFLSAKHTDSSALAIDGSILKKTYGSSGFVQLVFNSGQRKCAVTVETRRQVKVLSEAVTCQ